MKIGFSKVNVTPPLGTLMAGQLLPYKTRGIESDLYATTMCLDDSITKVIFVSCDVLLISNETAAKICAAVHKATGVTPNNVVIGTTHTHSGPITQDIFGMDTDTKYTEELKLNIVEAARQACENCREASLLTGKGQLEGYAFNRRFIMSDGTVETHPLKLDPHIVRPEGPDSKDLKVLYAADAEGKTMGAVVVFGCHGTVMERDNQLISSDYPGKVTEYVSQQLGGDVPVLFLQGACGNICQVNPLDASHREVGLEWARTMGKAIGKKVVELIQNHLVEVNGPIRVITETIQIPRRTIEQDLVDWANKHKNIKTEIPILSNYGTETYGQIERPKVSLAELFKTPFWANFYTNEIKTRQKDYSKQAKMPFTIKVIAQDNWAIVALPCELFIEWSNAICEKSPFDFTAVVELANGWNGYIPTEEAFERKGGYETKEVTSTMLVPETGKIILGTVLGMLKKINNEKVNLT